MIRFNLSGVVFGKGAVFMGFIIFLWMFINVGNFVMKKVQPETDWYFYYSMVVGVVFTVILKSLI